MVLLGCFQPERKVSSKLKQAVPAENVSISRTLAVVDLESREGA